MIVEGEKSPDLRYDDLASWRQLMVEFLSESAGLGTRRSHCFRWNQKAGKSPFPNLKVVS